MADDSTTREAALTENPAYRAAVVDLLGVLAYGEISAFERLAADSAMAPRIQDKEAIASMAATEFRNYELLRNRLVELGVDPSLAMEPFRQPLDEFHAKTAPTDWIEGLVKAYVGDGIATDFYRQISTVLDAQTRALVLDACADNGQAEYIVQRVRSAIDEDPRIAGRLALWGRRLVGEALSQAQRVAAEREPLANLLVGGVEVPGADLAQIGHMLAELTENHTKRMTALGLAA
jgi:hypothetical protein